ncbi:hypothetical protein [Kribbella sp. CA-294648]|uniref:hypothetical protein n=1 Tax=Kribbella sp. CA-294648 TaxID=3239948 RepID=UPI003D8B3429
MLTTYERVVGDDCLEPTVILHNLGALSYRLGDYGAPAAPRPWPENMETMLGTDHPEVAMTLGECCCSGPDPRIAVCGRAALRRAIAVLTATVGQSHPSLAAPSSGA